MSGWSCATIIAANEIHAEKILQNLNEYDKIQDIRIDSNRVSFRINGYFNDIKRIAEKQVMFNNEKFIIVEANDTTDSGEGELYEVINNVIKLIDVKEGEECCKAYDVATYFEKNYGIRPRVR